ncbi:MAG: patatin-like phospholipase RssA [Burkholderiales bacterium]
MAKRKPKIGLALGGGSARGWSHIGVIRALEKEGIRPDVVCGTSAGALVGAIYTANELDWLEDWVLRLTWRHMVSMLDLSFSGGIIQGNKLIDFFRSRLENKPINQLALPFGAVATELETGREVWLRDGDLLEAVRASIAFPGLFSPQLRDDVWLLDGGLVNPVPVSLARAMGADVVIAVDLNSDTIGSHLKAFEDPVESVNKKPEGFEISKTLTNKMKNWVLAGTGILKSPSLENKMDRPSFFSVVETSINIMQVRITRARLAGEPADILLTPKLGHLGLMDYHRASIAIEEGKRAVKLMLPAIHAMLEPPQPRQTTKQKRAAKA